MKKLKFLLISIVFLSFLWIIPLCVAWKNESYANYPDNFDYENDYGTHDWIADAALDSLLKEDESSWGWLNERKEIFLLGTEAPDNGDLKTTLDGETVEGFGDTAKHHIYFDQEGSVISDEDDSAKRAEECGDLAKESKEKEKFEVAAFYLGAMAHYIADMGMYSHVAENNKAPYYKDFDEYHTKVEGYVESRTNDNEDKERFFTIHDPTIEEKDPYDAAKDLAWDTYKDKDASESTTRDANWLHDHFFTNWADTGADREKETDTRQLYYDRIEESLNNAIDACASAMLFVGGMKSSPSYSIPLLIGATVSAIISIIIIKLRKKTKIEGIFNVSILTEIHNSLIIFQRKSWLSFLEFCRKSIDPII